MTYGRCRLPAVGAKRPKSCRDSGEPHSVRLSPGGENTALARAQHAGRKRHLGAGIPAAAQAGDERAAAALARSIGCSSGVGSAGQAAASVVRITAQ